MKIGDLVSHDNSFWLVTRYDPKRTRTATLLKQDGVAIEIPHDEPVEVIANPGMDWPFVAAPLKPMWGPVTHLSRPNRSGTLDLVIYQDWLPSEPARAGGSVFLNPNLRLQVGDFLLARHTNGKSSSIVIPAHFGTVAQKLARKAAKPKPDRTAYTRLLDEDPFGEED